ncbi:MAG: serine/threonine-protein kinase [Myxococcota bacterium]|nr:serine/threonine-protein kinase [Myxococcota bacterium]
MRKIDIERYEVKELLGQGGMSVVYRAFDRQLKRDVALKVLHDFLAAREDARRRFQREAIAVAQLRHQGIVEIYDYSGDDSKEAYIVTELIEGPTLREYIDNLGQLKHPELAVILTIVLTEALHHAHENGVIHRDLKPEKNMVTKSGNLKLLDFGIAQISGGPRLTATGTLLGSPAHMAPEIIDGERSDARGDIFSVGTILYWLATGRLPFEAANPSALFKRILDGEFEDPQMLEPKIGNNLSRTIKRALAPNRDERFANTSELLDALYQELELLGLELPDIAAREFIKHPIAYGDMLTEDLTKRLTELGQKAANEKEFGKAMDYFNRVLAIEPNNEDIHREIQKITRTREFSRYSKRVIAAGFIASIAVAGGLGLAQLKAQEPSSSKPKAVSVVAPASTPSIKPKSAEPMALKTTVTATRAASTVQPQLQTSRPQRPAKLPRKPPVPQTIIKSKKVGSQKKLTKVPKQTVIKSVDVEIKVGNSFADIYVDGKLYRKDFFRGKIALSPGKHRFEVIKPGMGRFKPKTIVVSAKGDVMQVSETGETKPVYNALLFSIPKQEGNEPPDWIPEPVK